MDISITIASKLLERNVTKEDNERLIEETFKQIEARRPSWTHYMKRHIVTVLAALGGLVLFGYAVRRAGVAEILDGIRQVGWGLLPILGLAGARFLIRAARGGCACRSTGAFPSDRHSAPSSLATRSAI